jgi:hypothetical protein
MMADTACSWTRCVSRISTLTSPALATAPSYIEEIPLADDSVDGGDRQLRHQSRADNVVGPVLPVSHPGVVPPAS